jgi:hypothetical protein
LHPLKTDAFARRTGIIRIWAANYVNCDHLSEKGNQIVAGIFQAAIQGQAK